LILPFQGAIGILFIDVGRCPTLGYQRLSAFSKFRKNYLIEQQ